MRARLERFMYGRYGQDNLSRVLTFAALALYLVGLFTQWVWVSSLGLALLIWCVFRMFSRNVQKRAAENMAFLGFWGRIRRFFAGIVGRLKGGRTHRYYKCPSCKQQLRVPKGRGTLRIDCPKCHESFTKKT